MSVSENRLFVTQRSEVLAEACSFENNLTVSDINIIGEVKVDPFLKEDEINKKLRY